MSFAQITLISALFVPLLAMPADVRSAEGVATDADNDFVGVWSTHYQTTFVYLIIHSDRTANFILLDQGHSISQTRWYPAKNGIIVDGLPMFRFWKGDSPDTARVQMQEFPQEMTNDTFGRFPLCFIMRKQKKPEPTSTEPGRITVPKEWLNDEPPSLFDERIGVPRAIAP
ncbi:MAG: hypothetical protein R3C12_06250 [Planctomycetaceae bacterium]|nr:hypothetical protein [Planctomycetaceae bacterium]